MVNVLNLDQLGMKVTVNKLMDGLQLINKPNMLFFKLLFILQFGFLMAVYSQDNKDYNYVKTVTANVGKGLPEELLSGDASYASTVYKYYDGLGRLIQIVRHQQSPSKMDIVQPISYDLFGREPAKYLPYVEGNDGYFKKDFLPYDHPSYRYRMHAQFYKSAPNVPSDEAPYLETIFENSPLNRPLKQYGAGQAWRANGGKYISFEYGTNLEGEVRLFEYDDKAHRLTDGGYYATASLYMTATTDEDGNEVREYKDKQERVVCKKVESGSVRGEIQYAATYYVYNVFGDLAAVIQPEGSKSSLSASVINNFCFQYRYDTRRRMIKKKVPGSGWVFMVYDDRDRLVLTQDSVQREGRHWLFTKYDELNRPILTGMYELPEARSQESMQSAVNAFYTTHPVWGEPVWGERRKLNGMHGYTNATFPNVSDANNYLTVTYYDNYAFMDQDTQVGWGDYAYKNDYLIEEESTTKVIYRQPLIENPRVKGLVTGTKTKILRDGRWIQTVTYYDDKYRVIQTVNGNHIGGIDRNSTLYSFTGLVLRTKETHKQKSNGHSQLRTFLYDHAGRLLQTELRLDDGKPVILSRNAYNELGELTQKKLHYTNANTFAQQVDFTYNIRGWLKSINRPDPLMPTPPEPADLFDMELIYHDKLKIKY